MPAHDGGVAVVGQRDRSALKSCPYRAAAEQLAALLRPGPAALGEDPRGPGVRVVPIPAHESGIAVAGQRNRRALKGGSYCTCANQLTALLRPDTAATGKKPCCPGVRVVGISTHDGGIAVVGQRD